MRFLLTSELLLTQRWFLYPPDQEPHFHPNRTTLSWVTETYPNLLEDEAPLECTIRPGEVTPPNLLTTRPKHTQQGRFISASISVKTWKLVHVCKVKSFVWTLTPDAGELSSDPFRTPQINSWFKRRDSATLQMWEQWYSGCFLTWTFNYTSCFWSFQPSWRFSSPWRETGSKTEPSERRLLHLNDWIVSAALTVRFCMFVSRCCISPTVGGTPL